MDKRIMLWMFLIIAAVGCSSESALTPEPRADLPNPASTYCEELGYTLEMREGETGIYGVCILPDGTECEEWAFFRGTCPDSRSSWGTAQLSLTLLESFPVQVRATVTGTLPDNCTRVERVEQSFNAERNEYWLQVVLTRVAGSACVAEAVPFEISVDLDVAGLLAGEYSVLVGDLRENFTLSADNVLPAEEPDSSAVPAGITAEWPEVTNPNFGFRFRLPPAWTVVEEEDPVHTLYGHQIQLFPVGVDDVVISIAYKEAADDMRLTRSGMREGDLVAYGTVNFLNAPVQKTRLEFEGRVMGIYYDGAGEIVREPLVFTLAVDYLGDSLRGPGIPPEIEQLTDLVVGSFTLETR